MAAGQGNPGLTTDQVAPYFSKNGGVIPIGFVMDSSVSASQSLHTGTAPFPYFIYRVCGVMQTAGGAGDTIQLTNQAGTAITEAFNCAGLAQYATFTFATINAPTCIITPDNWTALPSRDVLCVTASGADALIFIDAAKWRDTTII